MANRKFLAKIFIQSLNSGKKISQTLNGDGAFEVADIADPRPADLLIYDLGPKAVSGLSLVESLIKSREVGEVFLTSDSIDSSVLLQAMRMGVKEFLAQPLSETDLSEALGRFKERQNAAREGAQHKSGNIISLFGSKGGVGTTTIAVNLAVALNMSTEKKSVVLIDMNTLFGEIPLFLEMAPKFHWGEITKNIERLDETFLNNVLTRHRSGIQVLPSPAYLNGHVRPTPETMSKLLALMRRMFDYVIVDAGQSTNDTTLKVLEISDTLLLVTILSLPCLANANKMIKSLTDLGYVPNERIRVVLNRHIRKGDISIEDAEAGLGKKLFCTIPNDFTATMAAINNGKPLLEIAPKADISKSLVELASMLVKTGEAAVGGAKKKLPLFS
jgi:pilus assembly protein CpaE